MLSAVRFNLDQSKILSSGKEPILGQFISQNICRSNFLLSSRINDSN